MNRSRLLVLFVLSGLVVACGESTPIDEAEAGTSSSGGSGEGTGGGTTGGPTGTSDDPDPSGPGSDSTTSGEDSSDATGPHTTGAQDSWPDSCRTVPTERNCTDGMVVSGELSCQMSFIPGTQLCGPPLQRTVELAFEPGYYVFGTPLREDTPLTLEGEDEDDVAALCTHEVGTWEVDTPTNASLEIHSAISTPTPLFIREVESLCTAPEHCCWNWNGPPECSNPGLMDCVFEVYPRCETFWDTTCVETAMLRCGANCLG